MDALEENGIEVDVIRPAKMDIHHCTGCNRCIDTDSCYMQDDMQVIYDAFDGSDVFILATPVYFSGPSSILKQEKYWIMLKATATNLKEKLMLPTHIKQETNQGIKKKL